MNNKVFSTRNLYISQSLIPNSGRGVFAGCKIKKGEIIEKCPVIEIPEDDVANLNGSYLVNYFYYLGSNKEKLKIALGFGSIYNHTFTPNARYKGMQKQQTIDFIALKDIKKDEEITVNYIQGKRKYKHPLWFENKEPNY